jgi:preprotein translocase subunit SecF
MSNGMKSHKSALMLGVVIGATTSVFIALALALA